MTNRTTSSLPSREKPKFTNESAILKPADVKIHPDEWPCFLLGEAVVYGGDGKTLANLLDAELDGPLVVRGQLHLNKDQKHLLTTPYVRGRPLEVSDVREFSFDEVGTIWAKGVAGWFEVQPAVHYKGVYDTMAAGVDLYFFATDLYIENAAKKRNGGSMRLDLPAIFNAYRKKRSLSKSDEEIKGLFRSNGGFLMSMMRKPHSQVHWKRSTIYSWLVQELPEIYCKFDDVKARLKGKNTADNTRKTKSHSKSPIPAQKTLTGSVAAAIIAQKMEAAHLTGRCRRQELTLSRLSKILYTDYELGSVFTARELIRVHAQRIYDRLGDDWSTSPIFIRLESILSAPRKPRPGEKELLEITLRPRETGDGNALESMEADSEEPEDKRHSTTRGRHKQTESDADCREIYSYPYERETTSDKHKVVESMNRRSGKRRPREESEESDAITPMPATAVVKRSTRSGKVAALRLKRSSPLGDRIAFDSERPRKIQRMLRSQIVGEETIHLEEAGESTTSGSEEKSEQELEPEEDKRGIVLVEEHLPTSEPQGPNGQWICPKPECGHLIHKAEEAESQESIKAHYAEHAILLQEQMDRINLVKQESRPHLPISHLLEKLTRLGQEAVEKEKMDINGRTLPKPIKRENIMM